MNKIVSIALASVVAMIAMVLFLHRSTATPSSDQLIGDASHESIMLFCAASNRAVMDEILKDYESEFGRKVNVQYGPSQTLLSQLEVSGAGDLYLPADDSFLEIGKKMNLIAEVLPIARMQAGVAVARGNPKSIHSLDDLFRDDVRLVQANPDAAAIGKLTRKVLSATGTWDRLKDATTAERMTVTEAANDVLVGAADAAIVYDAVLHTYPDLEFVAINELDPASSDVAIGVIESSAHPTAALHFARYVTARDRGLRRYREHGFTVTDGDQWSDVPELTLYAGSMLRPAIDDTIDAFEKREGVRVNRNYNGCGILVGQMKGGHVPDAYFACDREFMQQVPDLFPESVDVSENELVIAVQKGNPHGIQSLRDLTKPGLQVGIGHEKQCAMGWLTQNTFREGGIQREVMANVTVQSPTGDMLVNQMRSGSLDAAVVYLSNLAGSGDVLDAVRIEGLPCSIATQPFAITPKSPYAQTASRLFQRIASTDSQANFAAEGFRWKLDSEDDSADE